MYHRKQIILRIFFLIIIPGNQLTQIRFTYNNNILKVYFISFVVSFGTFSFSYPNQMYIITQSFQDLTPNMGMHWYLFINTFTRYEKYFLALCSCFVFTFCVPLLIRFVNYPLEMAVMLQLLRQLLHPRPTMQEISFAFALAALTRRTLMRMGNASIISVIAMPVPVILYIIDYWLWLQSGSGNANYMFFQCLTFNLFCGIFTLDFISSTLKRDKALCLTSKKCR